MYSGIYILAGFRMPIIKLKLTRNPAILPFGAD